MGVSVSRTPASARVGVGVASVWGRDSVSVSWSGTRLATGLGRPAMRSALAGLKTAAMSGIDS